MRHGDALLGLLAFALLLGALAFLAPAERGSERLLPPATIRLAAAEPSLLRLEETATELAAPEERQPPSKYEVEASPDRVRAALDELASLLRRAPPGLSEWEVLTAAIVSGWSADEHACLFEVLAGTERDALRVLATAELARQVSPPVPDVLLSSTSLGALRGLWSEPDVEANVRTLAAVALAAVGPLSESSELLDQLALEDDEQRLRACRALSRTRHAIVALSLEELAVNADPRGAELALIALEDLAPRHSDQGTAGVGAGLERLLEDSHATPAVRRRALAALAAWAPDRLLTLTLELFETQNVEPELFAAAARELARPGVLRDPVSLELGLHSPGVSSAGRLVLAETLALRCTVEGADPRIRRLTMETLAESLRAAERSEERRRALVAYASLATPGEAGVLDVVAREDPDPTLRTTAIRLARELREAD